MNNIQLVKRAYEAFTEADRKFYEQHLSDEFRFSSPIDVNLDKDGYFKRCWPGAGKKQKFHFLRLITFWRL